MSIFNGKDANIDLGSGHLLFWGGWSPDIKLNPQYRMIPAFEQGEHYGAFIRHPVGPRPQPRHDAEFWGAGWCVSSVAFDTATMRALMAITGVQATWQVESWNPLTISPSVLCACGDHGFIRNDLWVTA